MTDIKYPASWAPRVFTPLAAFWLAMAVPGGVTYACGYEDPTTIAIGVLNFAYPDALHVGTAVWQAQMEGRLPRTEPATPAADDPVRRQAATWEVMRLNERLRAFFESWPATAALPAVVFVDTGMWTRFVRQEGRVVTVAHQSGPAGEAVVLVTMPVALRAVLDNRVSFAAALKSGIMRGYGIPTAQDQLRDAWREPAT